MDTQTILQHLKTLLEPLQTGQVRLEESQAHLAEGLARTNTSIEALAAGQKDLDSKLTKNIKEIEDELDIPHPQKN